MKSGKRTTFSQYEYDPKISQAVQTPIPTLESKEIQEGPALETKSLISRKSFKSPGRSSLKAEEVSRAP